MRPLLALLLLPALAGCFHGEEAPPAEVEIAIFPIGGLDDSAFTGEFEIVPGVAYWRTDLLARTQRGVSYVAHAPGGERVESQASAQFPFTHELRVESPAAGTWNVTLRAQTVVEGTLRILVPA